MAGYIFHCVHVPQFLYSTADEHLGCFHVLSSVQSLSCVRLFATPWIAAHQASLSITNSWSSLTLTSIKSVMPSSHLILCRPLLFLPSIPPSIRVFSNESTLHMRWPKYWSFSFSIILSKEIPGLISFRMDWLGLLAVQGTLLVTYKKEGSTDACCSIGETYKLDVWLQGFSMGRWKQIWRGEYQNIWPASWETYMQVRKQQLELDMEQQTGSK